MSDDREDGFRRAFHLKSLRSAMMTNPNAEDWRSVRKVIERCEKARAKADRLFGERYSKRVVAERLRLINRAGALSRDLKPGWAGNDRFNRWEIDHQADRNVRFAHHARLTRIDSFEIKKLEALFAKTRARDADTAPVREAFTQNASRRRKR